MDSNQVELGIVALPAFSAYVIRRAGCGPADLGPLMSEALEAVFARGLTFIGPPMIHYIDIPRGSSSFSDLTVDAVVPVDVEAAHAAGLPLTLIPDLPLAAVARFRGPHELMPQVYGTLLNYIDEMEYRVTGLPRELYVEYAEDKNHLTEICFPIADGLPEGARQSNGEASPHDPPL